MILRALLSMTLAGLATLLAAAQVWAPPPVGSQQWFELQVADRFTGFAPTCQAVGSRNDILQFVSPDDAVRLAPGPLQVPAIVCERPLTAEQLDWAEWRAAVEVGSSDAVTDAWLGLYDETGTAVRTWALRDAWPSRLEVSVDAERALERLTISFQSFGTAPADSGTPDAGSDAGEIVAADGGVSDAGDGGRVDIQDAGPSGDAGVDAGAEGGDAGTPDAGAGEEPRPGGCGGGCATSGEALIGMLGLLWWWAPRRRRVHGGRT